jgi:exopolyphosphatase/guanosine-5'-triphosphate,3'-diphosphate pyrophosphatase
MEQGHAVSSADERIGIIDIGSNSIRLVVYDRLARMPAVLFNEKVMAGLGRGLAETGAIDDASLERAMTALARFKLLAEQIGVSQLSAVATAAVRDASNGDDFLARIAGLGIETQVLSGAQEARMAGYGVLSAFPGADGLVGDLGGGSLELIRVKGGEVHEGASFPLGVLRLATLAESGPDALERAVAQILAAQPWLASATGRPFYLVGGSWRALARIDMHLKGYALPIVHDYRMAPDTPTLLMRQMAEIEPKRMRDAMGVTGSRIPTLGAAADLLATLVRQLGPSELVVSSHGLREGLLFDRLSPEVRAQDPLICATREMGQVLGRYPEHGDLLDRWIAPLFDGDGDADHRLRHAACLLADIGWRAHPEFRQERGLEIALHGNWVGVDARGRAMIAQALYTNYGGSGQPEALRALAPDADLARAENWGLALRLGQRLSAGVADGLRASRVSLDAAQLALHLKPAHAALAGESVERRLKVLAAAMGRAPALIIGNGH